jgi:hypothetical protein
MAHGRYAHISPSFDSTSSVAPWPDLTNNLVYRGFNILMFPNAQDCPPCAFQANSSLFVSFNVSRYLRSPVISVSNWDSSMLATSVPKASVNENRDLNFGECNINLDMPTVIDSHPGVSAIAKSHFVQR